MHASQPTLNNYKLLPDYKDQSAQSKNVISAGIAEIQMPWTASAEHLLVLWIPAIPAGKTLLLRYLYNQELLMITLKKV
ncbi:hypothetical protein [Methylicorpusculum sp.]|uniref:hypothetical protein n=1 Tax=Methylicorpusculum sp. TaxID=2713644 RepID=UPI00272B7463|nr:hypothetical protein [Methylicorpusculum sp.]